MTIPGGLFFLAGDRLSKQDYLGATGTAIVALITLDYTYNLYKTNQQSQKERLEQNERLIKEEAQREKEERIANKS